MVQRPTIFHKCTTDVSPFRVFHSKHLNPDFFAHCHLPAGMAFVELKASCKETGYVAEYLSFSFSHAFDGLEPISTALIKAPVTVKFC
jgi:hypothetical protein